MERGNYTSGELREVVDELFEVSDREVCRILAMYIQSDAEDAPVTSLDVA